MKRVTSTLLVVFCLYTVCFSQKITWYRFDKTFISSQYSDSAIGSLTFTDFHPAKNVHETACGGDDGELHIGMRLPEVKLAGSQMPLTDGPEDGDKNWGLVAELPNASLGSGPAKLTQLANKSISFQGYFRVWDEGHGSGASPLSNPHHVFEIHPAWGFTGPGVSFISKSLVASMKNYRGYGASKFRGMFKDFTAGTWPLAYQTNKTLFLGLVKNANFYQLPVKVRSIKSVSGGHEVMVEVFSDQPMKKSVYSKLTAVTATGSPIDTALHVGQKVFLLGFFSVNLKKAMDESSSAHAENTAVPVQDALEFFVFGVALKPAVKSCS